jgi:predicted peptidase
VDAFGYRVAGWGMTYRLYTPPPRRHGRHPLVVWLHGGGEGASLPDGYYDNETPLRANRGALGFATPQAQSIFGGAYVVAPQSTSYWIEDGPRFAPLIRRIVDELVRRHPIDRERIYLAGASNGGYMTMELTSTYRDLRGGRADLSRSSRAARRCSPMPSCRRSTRRRGSSPHATTRSCRSRPTPSTPTRSSPGPC